MNLKHVPHTKVFLLPQRLRHALARASALLGQALLPQTCVLCSLPSGNRPVCDACTADLPRLVGYQCPRCGLPLHHHANGGCCPDCSHHTPAFETASAIWSYGFPVDTLIQDFKYGHHLYLAGFFGQHLAQMLKKQWATNPANLLPDLVIPMPLHPNRLKTRGFNQAAEIARHAAKSLDLPWQSDVLIRLHDTEPQAGLRREERWSNMRGAFACTEPLQGARILLVDDVLTTGASLSACAEVLRHAGASHIDVAVLARTPEPNAAH